MGRPRYVSFQRGPSHVQLDHLHFQLERLSRAIAPALCLNRVRSNAPLKGLPRRRIQCAPRPETASSRLLMLLTHVLLRASVWMMRHVLPAVSRSSCSGAAAGSCEGSCAGAVACKCSRHAVQQRRASPHLVPAAIPVPPTISFHPVSYTHLTLPTILRV